jgi:hypothetical protein
VESGVEDQKRAVEESGQSRLQREFSFKDTNEQHIHTLA